MNIDTESFPFATIPYLVYEVMVFQLIKEIFTKTIISPCFREAYETKSEVQDLSGREYLVSREGISWKKLTSGSTSLWIELSFNRKELKTENWQSKLEAIVYSIKHLSNDDKMRIGNDLIVTIIPVLTNNGAIV